MRYMYSLVGETAPIDTRESMFGFFNVGEYPDISNTGLYERVDIHTLKHSLVMVRPSRLGMFDYEMSFIL